eukprot:7793473-Prorocentrum_lima.AAC.1
MYTNAKSGRSRQPLASLFSKELSCISFSVRTRVESHVQDLWIHVTVLQQLKVANYCLGS